MGEERLKAKCRDLDLAYAIKNGVMSSAQSIARELIIIRLADPSLYLGAGEEWGEMPNVSRTVGRWRKSYSAELKEMMQLHKGTQIAK
jgi:hypothetical protein